MTITAIALQCFKCILFSNQISKYRRIPYATEKKYLRVTKNRPFFPILRASLNFFRPFKLCTYYMCAHYYTFLQINNKNIWFTNWSTLRVGSIWSRRWSLHSFPLFGNFTFPRFLRTLFNHHWSMIWKKKKCFVFI